MAGDAMACPVLLDDRYKYMRGGLVKLAFRD
jgi:hypothetical protein